MRHLAAGNSRDDGLGFGFGYASQFHNGLHCGAIDLAAVVLIGAPGGLRLLCGFHLCGCTVALTLGGLLGFLGGLLFLRLHLGQILSLAFFLGALCGLCPLRGLALNPRLALCGFLGGGFGGLLGGPDALCGFRLCPLAGFLCHSGSMGLSGLLSGLSINLRLFLALCLSGGLRLKASLFLSGGLLGPHLLQLQPVGLSLAERLKVVLGALYGEQNGFVKLICQIPKGGAVTWLQRSDLLIYGTLKGGNIHFMNCSVEGGQACKRICNLLLAGVLGFLPFSQRRARLSLESIHALFHFTALSVHRIDHFFLIRRELLRGAVQARFGLGNLVGQ